MKYNDFIKDPQWPQNCFENSFPVFNSDEENSHQNSPSNIIAFPHITQPIKQQIEESESVISSSIEIKEEQKDQIYYSEEQEEQENQDENSDLIKIEEDENWEQERSSKNKKIQKKKKQMVKRQYERGKYKILDQKTKKKIVEETLENTIVDVARKYGVSVNNICRWRKRCDRRSGAGRKVTDSEMQEKLLQWISRQSGIISRKAIQTKAKQLGHQEDFKASKGWFERFYKRNKFYFGDQLEILTTTHYKRRIKDFQKHEQHLQDTGVKEEEIVEVMEEEQVQKNLFEYFLEEENL